MDLKTRAPSPAADVAVSPDFNAWFRRLFSGDALYYWILAILLCGVQFAFTIYRCPQLRYEETAESIRNVFWLDEHGIFDGSSSNVGYYGLLLAVYRIFGFSVFTAKYVRAVLAVFTIFSLAWIARKSVGGKYGLAALAAAGLSPTMLYLNTIQTSYGMDLQYVPICLALLIIHPFDSRPVAYVLSFVIGLVCMVAAMSYPTFVMAMPIIGLCGVALFYKQCDGHILWKRGGLHLLSFLCGLAVPFVFALCWLEQPGVFLSDPALQGRGVFRGAGAFLLDFQNFSDSIRACLNDLFNVGASYYFEVPVPDFGSPLGWCAFGGAAVSIVVLAWRSGRWWWFAGLGAMLAVGIVLPSLTSGPPGIRRCTTVLVAFYALYTLAWKVLATTPPVISPKARTFMMILLLLLPAHHLYALYWNWQSLPLPSKYSNRRTFWFNMEPTSDKSLDRILEFTKNGGVLKLVDPEGKAYPPVYSEIYAALCGYRSWNHLPEVTIKGFDRRNGETIELNHKLWDTYYFPH